MNVHSTSNCPSRPGRVAEQHELAGAGVHLVQLPVDFLDLPALLRRPEQFDVALAEIAEREQRGDAEGDEVLVRAEY